MNRKYFILPIFLISTVLFAQENSSFNPPYYLAMLPTDSIAFPSIYGDQSSRDSVYADANDFFVSEFSLEKYLLKKQTIDFLLRIDSSWQIRLTNDSIVNLKPEREYGISHYFFEHYYPDQELIVFKILQYEGGGYRLYNRKTGESIWTNAPPVFSPDFRYFICLSGDYGYLDNGIELYEIRGDRANLILSYDPGMAPLRVKWEDPSHLVLEMLNYSIMPREYQHFRAEIKKNK
ncbi:hypothetical protein [Fulvivirga sedimenti]|uniref:Uncharacterized protein n=1 Tax=Fulvivirga sedimenti TaxID=2879465 RepID=A0A9X1KW97_9BACT|nr:hypothetical protein [Fulvivirga sedimenti]MCA6073759.1 hypothetical protein [Fulvivirga sedimenti]